MDLIHFERQEASLCAQHAINMLLQGSYFSAVDLAEIATDMDIREGSVIDEAAPRSHNLDDSGYFSVQVIAEALKIFNLELIPLNSPNAAAYRNDPAAGQAYICNHLEHWFAVRRIGLQWFTLNSLMPTPKLITDTYLNMYFAQLANEGYSVFVVEGILPPCSADDQLMQCPIDPLLATRSDAFREDLRDVHADIERAKMLSLEKGSEEDDLSMALRLSQQQDGSGATSDDELERQIQIAIERSMESDLPQSSYAARRPLQDVASAAGFHPDILANDDSNDSNEIRSKRESFLKRFE